MTDAPVLPSHAYVPGHTARHTEGAFDPIRASVREGMSSKELARTEAFRAGLAFRASGHFWEAHEVLEPVWMACPPNSEPRAFVQAIIQLANAQLKLRMGKPRAATRLCQIALAHLDEVRGEVVLGCDVAALRVEVLALSTSSELQYNA
ncbi:DUF309 domain-containing protein [Flavimaricola marinus]|uniref:DUF309 domain-containing protein n=1 Tax=Flavimaricola marinus TaxID=1819565 RepID=A0A238LD93_9RHOB|nr:DUF309 domain-containing protein [Flavimaricola marinus]SMY06916.1 hypothetical protein LOM8899_01046 [Flavimaricola marinus]